MALKADSPSAAVPAISRLASAHTTERSRLRITAESSTIKMRVRRPCAIAQASTRPSIASFSLSASSSKGFIRYSSAPASSARRMKSFSASVVTIITLTSLNPSARRCFSISSPSITGIFQSTSARSKGAPAWSRSRPARPSEASSHTMPRSSSNPRKKPLTKRESSTISARILTSPIFRLRRLRGAQPHRIQPLRVQLHQQALLELVRAGKQCPPAFIQNRRIRLVIVRRNSQNLAHRVNQQPKAPTRALQNQNVLRAILGRQAEQLAQAHRGEYVAAIVNQAAHKRGSQRNRLRPRRAHDLKNVGDGHAKQRRPQPHRAHFHQRRRRLPLAIQGCPRIAHRTASASS